MYILYVMYKLQNICIKSKTFIYLQIIHRFLPNLQRLIKITKKCKKHKSENLLKSNKRINKTVIKSNVKTFSIYN